MRLDERVPSLGTSKPRPGRSRPEYAKRRKPSHSEAFRCAMTDSIADLFLCEGKNDNRDTDEPVRRLARTGRGEG